MMTSASTELNALCGAVHTIYGTEWFGVLRRDLLLTDPVGLASVLHFEGRTGTLVLWK